ncbi:hypothetical protein [Butyrivibrio sp. MC2013]|uniref:hypothetical protein n=1 Tax=Butyrivibrio sp. MC2013 TaxID=1280686 RepID=UPI0004083CE4|nr:hypothetical protein [Butyrivibrio sp. MC2013]
MLYHQGKKLTKELFENPTSRYRGAPFWAWNTKMTKDNVKFMTSVMQDMGMGGAHIHCRTGMANEYLGEEYMDLVRTAHEEFAKKDMLTWLYDEDRWPSGAAGGLVTRDHANRSRYLVFSRKAPEVPVSKENNYCTSAEVVSGGERKLIARYEVKLADGYLEGYRLLKEGESAADSGKEWYAYLEVSGDSPWFNDQAYVNTLDKKAIDCFIETTHERYYKTLGDSFGGDVPAIFTDEPQFSFKRRMGYALDEKDVTIPFSDDFEEDFTKRYGHSLLEGLPELFWEKGKDVYSLIRYEYHDFVSERFTEAFADNIGSWCKEHGILLTGHMMEEPTLTSQTAALGEAMRSYRSFGMPGIDMLCDFREYTTAKQAQSAARQFGAPGVLSELYGVTGYNFDFRGHKLQGDWQAALGVTVRVPHLSWTSMAGEAKRDYPASISYQSPWYREYKGVEDHFARVATAMTRGKAKVRVAVIHPIESFWLCWGNDEQTGDIRRQRDENFTDLTKWLLFGLMDFDFLAESLLPSLEIRVTKDARLKVGEMTYDMVLMPDLITVRSSTLDILEAFAAEGGKVIIAGAVPKLVDARPSYRPSALAELAVNVPYQKMEILRALDPCRSIDIRRDNGTRTDDLIYQLRDDGESSWLFIAHGEKPGNKDVPRMEKITIILQGLYRLTYYDTLTGEIYPLSCKYEGDRTILERQCYEHDSLLLRLDPMSTGVENAILCGDITDGSEGAAADNGILFPESKDNNSQKSIDIAYPESAQVQTDELNVLLLDMAESRLDDEDYRPKDEILRIDNHYRRQLGYPLRMEAWAQPWVNDKEEIPEHTLYLRYSFRSHVSGIPVDLAMEHPEDTKIIFNGSVVTGKDRGNYVDMDIHRIGIGELIEGINVIEVSMPFIKVQNVEAMYLLGNFGVNVYGSEAEIVPAPGSIHFGDISRQGFAFYGGNICYESKVDIPADGELMLSTTYYSCPLIGVEIDGRKVGNIAYSPYEISLGKVSKGSHTIRLTAYGNRMNTFGPLHLCDKKDIWQGPNAWRSEGSRWAYEYQLQPTGILKRPRLWLS